MIAVDLRGHGRSGSGDRSDTLPDALIADIAESVPHPVDLLIGHSFGGYLAQLAVLDGRLSAGHLLLEDPVSHQLPASITRPRLTADIAKRRSEQVVDDRARSDEQRIDDIWLALASRCLDAELALDMYCPPSGWDIRTSADAVRRLQPTRWLAPVGSEYVTEEDAGLLSADAVEFLPGVGHAIHRDDPDLFLSRALRLMEEK